MGGIIVTSQMYNVLIIRVQKGARSWLPSLSVPMFLFFNAENVSQSNGNWCKFLECKVNHFLAPFSISLEKGIHFLQITERSWWIGNCWKVKFLWGTCTFPLQMRTYEASIKRGGDSLFFNCSWRAPSTSLFLKKYRTRDVSNAMKIFVNTTLHKTRVLQWVQWKLNSNRTLFCTTQLYAVYWRSAMI